MALQKEIKLKNGITINYHRITSINTITNQCSIIEISSYTDEEKRMEEKLSQQGQEINVFIETQFINIDYDKNLNIDSAYAYIKTLPAFDGAMDI